jgi:NAD+ kinase
MGTDTKLLGINTGTLGFMAGLEANQLEKLWLLESGEYDISERMTLDVKMPDGRIFTALNEVCAKSADLKICGFEVYSEGYLIGRYRADGALFSTPSGSTAYALSAGGPIIEPDLECIEMTLICPHSLFSRATLFSAERRLCIVSDSNGMLISTDGEEYVKIGASQRVEISKGNNKIKFIDLIGNSFHESLCRKMMKPIK